MKELSIEEKAKRFDEAIEELRGLLDGIHEEKCDDIVRIFPELIESEDEKIRKWLISQLKIKSDDTNSDLNIMINKAISWLEKPDEHAKFRDSIQVGDNVTRNEDGVLVNLSQLNRVAKKDEKQGEHKPADKEYTFKAIPRLLGMISPTDRAKSYCQKLIDSLEQEGYSTDAKIVRGCLKQMNGEKVAMATMDEHKPTWLEKKGEQKPQGKSALEAINEEKVDNANKVEAKFKVGDWISGYYTNYKVLSVNNDGYLVEDVDGNKINILFENEKFHHFFTIADAKDGDVLIDKSNGKECPFIFKETKPSNIKTDVLNPLSVLGYCGIGGAGFTKGSGWGDTVNCTYYPANKEQQNLLFQKMKEAEYEWDAEKKELNKVEQKDVIHRELTEFEKAVKQVMEEAIECGDIHNLKADADMLLSLIQKPAEEYNITGIRSTHAKGKLGEMIKNLKSVKEMKVEPKFKDGDVLNSPSHHLIWIYRDNEHYYACLNMNYATKNVAIGGLIKIPSDARPATKDERTILFRKLKKFGYEWDKEKKQLKTKVIHKKLTEFEKAVKQVMEKAIGCGDTRSLKADAEMLLSLVHKSAWSEDDEKGLSDALWCCKQAASIAKDENDMGNAWYAEHWLKTLKERYTC